MFDSFRQFTDRLLGRGSAAITVPVMDGSLLPNRVLDNAEVVAELPGIDDLAVRGPVLLASAGPEVRLLVDGAWQPWLRFEGAVTALAVSPQGRVAVAIGGREIRVLGDEGQTLRRLDTHAGRPMVCLNALAWQDETALVFTDGSSEHGPNQWTRDLMTLGRSGRVGRWTLEADSEPLADGLGYAFGAMPWSGGEVLVSESWRHRLVRWSSRGGVPFLAELPSYPSRLAPASDGGLWLSCFVSRTQLVEFVLREPTYRQRMIREIDPVHWIAPALSSGHSFLEPLQGAGVKNMGVLKPWAPPRSYGLVMHLSADGRILRSLHSQVDGRHHGITAMVEHDGALYVASKGSGRLLRVSSPFVEGEAA